ncbi:hypothetical protein KC217_21820, partial [Mycobacterium tuberculosis]|nr:hypothetical protein [Mycobacterium tuberculosis]
HSGGRAAAAVSTSDGEASGSWRTSPFSPPPLPASVELEAGAQLAGLEPGDRAVVEAAAVLPPPVLLESLSALVAARPGRSGETGTV